MKVRFLTNCVADKKVFYVGDIADISEHDARFLVVTRRVQPIQENEEPVVEVQEEVVNVEEPAFEDINDFIGNGLESETREAEIKKESKKKAK